MDMTSIKSKTSPIYRPGKSKWNLRKRTVLVIVLTALILLAVVASGLLLSNDRLASSLEFRNLAPSLAHPFGTDWLGRDMLTRTLKGLTLSIGVGVLAAFLSTIIALTLGILAASMGKWVDRLISWLIDLFLSVPHLVALILIAFVLGGGMKGIIVGISLTHWPSLARVVRAEVLQLRSAEFIQISRKLGKSKFWIARNHIFPHILPQLIVGFLLLFPHAILHEAAVTFLGLGLSPHQPAIGIILSESMTYLSTGMWWLAFFPGLSLLIIVRSFDLLGENIRLLIDPHHSQL